MPNTAPYTYFVRNVEADSEVGFGDVFDIVDGNVVDLFKTSLKNKQHS